MSSKNNPDVRKARSSGTLVPMQNPKPCIDCQNLIVFARDQQMVQVGRIMQARHKKTPQGTCQDSSVTPPEADGEKSVQ